MLERAFRALGGAVTLIWTTGFYFLANFRPQPTYVLYNRTVTGDIEQCEEEDLQAARNSNEISFIQYAIRYFASCTLKLQWVTNAG